MSPETINWAGGIIVVILSIYTLASSVNRSSFKELQKVVAAQGTIIRQLMVSQGLDALELAAREVWGRANENKVRRLGGDPIPYRPPSPEERARVMAEVEARTVSMKTEAAD